MTLNMTEMGFLSSVWLRVFPKSWAKVDEKEWPLVCL